MPPITVKLPHQSRVGGEGLGSSEGGGVVGAPVAACAAEGGEAGGGGEAGTAEGEDSR